MSVGEHLSDHDKPRIDAHPDAEIPQPALLPQLSGIGPDTSGNLQPGADGVFRVVLPGEGRAKIGQHTVAHYLDDGSGMLLDRLQQAGIRLLHDLEEFFRVDMLGKGGETDQVCEQDRHDPPLVPFWQCG